MSDWGSSQSVLASIGPVSWLAVSETASDRTPGEVLSEAMRRCESPIERVTLGALVEAARIAPVSWWQVRVGDVVAKAGQEQQGGCRWLEIACQGPVGRYRADFVLSATDIDANGNEVSRRAVVECDGHEFHAASRAQVERDRKRDRDMQSAGYLVLRYPGSLLWREAMPHARDAVLVVLNAVAAARGFEREAAE